MHTTESHDVLRALRVEWRSLGRSRASRLALEGLRVDAPTRIPARVYDLCGLVDALEPRGGLERLDRAMLVEVLLWRADNLLVRRCLLQTLLPGIVSVARKLRFGEGIADDPGTFLAETLAEATDLLCDWAGQRRAYAAPDLLSALRCRMRRRMLADKARRQELRAVPDLASEDGHHGPDSVAHALAVSARTDAAVALLYARCVLGYSSSQLAGSLGISSGAIRRRLVTAAHPFLA